MGAAALAAAAPEVRAAVSAEDRFRDGVAAFKAGEYRRAAAYFEAARRHGMASPALFFNLGVSYYRLERYERAAEAFRQLTGDPTNGPLAHYNLGLVALAQGHDDRAREHLVTARDSARDERIRDLARDRLAELGDTGAAPSRLSLLLSASFGYDDNVTLAPDETVAATDTEDHFWQYLAAGTFQLTGGNRDGLQLKASVLGTDYADIDRFDQTYLRAGPEWDHRWGAWDTDLAAYADWVYLDGERFERVYTGEIEGMRPLGDNTLVRLRYRYSRIDGDDPYGYLSGDRHRAAIEGRFRGALDARLGYELEYNDRDDLRTDTSFTSVSPVRHEVFARGTYRVAGWEGQARAEYRLSRYPDANTDTTTGLDRERGDDRLRLKAALRRQLPWRLVGFAEYEHTRNDSNIDDYDYTASVYRLGLERFF
jgi:hypothetical protein